MIIMGVKCYIVGKVNNKLNSYGYEFKAGTLRLRGLLSYEVNNIRLSRIDNFRQFITADQALVKISFWSLIFYRFNALCVLNQLTTVLDEISPTPLKINDLTAVVNLRKGALLSEISIGKASCFVQIEKNETAIEFYLKVTNQSWNNLVDPLRTMFLTDIMKRSFSCSKLSVATYLNYPKTRGVPVFNAIVDCPDFSLSMQDGHNFTDAKISFHSMQSLLVSKALKGDMESYMQLSSFPELLVESVILTEDPGFKTHKGVNPAFVGLALRENIEKSKISRGASTITMQVVRNLFLTHDRYVIRKIEECILALLIENHFNVSKDHIVELYLNLIEFAPGIYGVKEASSFYFHKSPVELTVLEIIVMTYMIPRPKHFFDALLLQTDQLKRNLKNHVEHLSRVLLHSCLIDRETYDDISYKIDFCGIGLVLEMN